jgi:hypothetical protein
MITNINTIVTLHLNTFKNVTYKASTPGMWNNTSPFSWVLITVHIALLGHLSLKWHWSTRVQFLTLAGVFISSPPPSPFHLLSKVSTTSTRVKLLAHETDRSPPLSVEVHNAWSFNPSFPTCLHGVVLRKSAKFTLHFMFSSTKEGWKNYWISHNV